jgi:hypothetical protein
MEHAFHYNLINKGKHPFSSEILIPFGMKDRIFPIPALSAIFHKNTGRVGGSADHQTDQMYEGRVRGGSGVVRNFITGKPKAELLRKPRDSWAHALQTLISCAILRDGAAEIISEEN